MLAFWIGGGCVLWARRAILLAGGLLVFDSAATVPVGYTLTLSYVLIAAGCLIGAPELLRRWNEQPLLIRTVAPALLALYVLAAVTSQPATLAGSQRAGAQREYVYVLDLGLGLTTMLLIPTLWRRASAASLARAISIAGALAGAYGVYQWFALRYGLPFSDVNNTLDSNGVTTGASQGLGLFGAQRIRGTFLEPHFLGAFLAAALPLQAWTTLGSRGLMRTATAVGVVLSVLALLVTDSAPAWGMLLLGVTTGGLLVSIGRGMVKTSVATGIVAASMWLGIVPVLAVPTVSKLVTGRSSSSLSATTSFRTNIWNLDVRLWEQHPVLGYGPGQSAVQVAYAYAAPAKPRVLVSAQGLWASALLDAGIVGLCAWIYMFGAVLANGVVGVMRKPTVLAGAVFASALAVTIDVATSGDRLDPRHWLVLGLLLAVSGQAARAKPSDREQETN